MNFQLLFPKSSILMEHKSIFRYQSITHLIDLLHYLLFEIIRNGLV